MTIKEYLKAGDEAGYQKYYLVWCYATKRNMNDDVAISEYIAWINKQHAKYKEAAGDKNYIAGYSDRFLSWMIEQAIADCTKGD